MTSSSSPPDISSVAYRSIPYIQQQHHHQTNALFASPRPSPRARLHGPYAPLHPSIHRLIAPGAALLFHAAFQRPTQHPSIHPEHRVQILPTAKRADKPSRPRNRPEPVCSTQAVCLPNPGTSLPLLQVSQPLCDLHSAIQAPWDVIC